MLTIEFLFKDGGLTFAEADLMSGVHRYKTTEAEGCRELAQHGVLPAWPEKRLAHQV
jgi:hypothetical protein